MFLSEGDYLKVYEIAELYNLKEIEVVSLIKKYSVAVFHMGTAKYTRKEDFDPIFQMTRPQSVELITGHKAKLFTAESLVECDGCLEGIPTGTEYVKFQKPEDDFDSSFCSACVRWRKKEERNANAS